jgi:hypothetical protein
MSLAHSPAFAPNWESSMLTVEEQISRVADAAVARTAAVSLDQPTHGRRVTPPAVGVAAAVLVAGCLVALVWMVELRPGANSPTPASAPPLPVENSPTVSYPVDEAWLVPMTVPDGWQHGVAFPILNGSGRVLTYEDPINGGVLTINTGVTAGSAPADAATVEFGGRTWLMSTADPSGMPQYFLDGDWPGIGPVSVTWHGLDDDTVAEVIASLAAGSVAGLERPPLPPTGSILVAEAKQDGVPKRLLADTDGVNVAMSVDGGGGGPTRLPAGEALALGGASGPNPTSVIGGRESESLVWGLVSTDVDSVVVELTDGRTVTTKPQDLSDRFIEQFFFIAVPTRTEGGLELATSLVAFDADGNELARIDNAF